MASYIVDMSDPVFQRQQTIEQVWEVSRQCLIDGSPVIIIPVGVEEILGPEGVEIIAQRYR